MSQSIIEPAKYLGETLGFWIQTGALIISAFAAVYIIWDNDKNEQRRATVDLVKDLKLDHELVKARKVVLRLHHSKQTNLARYLDNHESEEYQAILKSLNNYEFIASGIREGAFDEQIFKRMQYSVVVKDWNALHPFVAEFRNQNGIRTLFQEFEWLGTKWNKKPLPNDSDG